MSTTSSKKDIKSRLKKFIDSVLVGLLIALSYLPFWVLYGISDFFYLVFKYVIKYRRNVINQNLKNSFPEKTEAEREEIATRFYHHLCDVMVETIKGYSMNTKQMDNHVKFPNVKLLNDHYDKGKGVIMVGMHYNNWEWNGILQKYAKPRIIALYNPIRGNDALENFLLRIRTKWGAEFIPVNRSRRLMVELSKMEHPAALALGADQTSLANSKFWTIFMNQESPFFSGPEKIAAYTNYAVVFHHMKKIKRGKYEVEFVPLFENPKEVKPEEIMLTYIRKMEEIIRKEPEYYLWSHRRWKHKRHENIPLTL